MISEGLMNKLSVMGLCDDSRKVKPGDLFFSIPADDYVQFARNAIAAGAVAVVGEVPAPEGLASKWIQVADVKQVKGTGQIADTHLLLLYYAPRLFFILIAIHPVFMRIGLVTLNHTFEDLLILRDKEGCPRHHVMTDLIC